MFFNNKPVTHYTCKAIDKLAKPLQVLESLGSTSPSIKYRNANKVVYLFIKSNSIFFLFIFGTIPLIILCTISLVPTAELISVAKVFAFLTK